VFRDPQVNTYVRDVEATVRFYTEALGFVETFRTPESGPPVHVEVRLGGLILGFADIEATREMHGLEVDAGPKRAEVAVWTDDVDAAFARLVASGARPLSRPHNFIGRLRAAWVADPDGGPVQIVTELAASPSPPS
jgi:catechol 2,3-dioxygenase-like lactoylglutathione lyase family enzyme